MSVIFSDKKVFDHLKCSASFQSITRSNESLEAAVKALLLFRHPHRMSLAGRFYF